MRKRIVLVISLLISSWATEAAIRLPALISNGVVLQRNTSLKLWGWGDPGEEVVLNYKNKLYKTVTSGNGQWMIKLPSQSAGGPFRMIFTGSNSIVVDNILFGDVWICSGQSNMELEMERLKYRYPTDVNVVTNASIRQYTVRDQYDFNGPRQDLDKDHWISVQPGSTSKFSGVAYFFATALYEKYKVPIGLINAALGGSPIESWISEASIQQLPTAYTELLRFKNQALIDEIETKDRATSKAWYTLLYDKDPGIKNNWSSPLVDEQDWKQMNVPGYWADNGKDTVNGSVWFRKSVNIPIQMTGKKALLELGRIVDADSVFVNGILAGTTSYQYPPRRYELPAGVLKEGSNNITIRVINNSGRGGFVPDKPYRIIAGNDTLNVSGNWKYKVGAVMQPLPGQTFIRWKPVGLYNAMIAPLTAFAIKGVIWFQGEANAGAPAGYAEKMDLLINDWRNKWNQGNFPFLYVQLANFMQAQSQPKESSWAALRQQQLLALRIPHTGMAVAIDAGDWNDIHPENKEVVGRRLALQAERVAYGNKKIVASGPLYQSMTIQGNKIILHFTNTGSGLVAKNGDLQHFAIAGADKKYTWAQAIIKGKTIVVWSNDITQPVSVRYAWADNPDSANLYNKEGLPASPFTTVK